MAGGVQSLIVFPVDVPQKGTVDILSSRWPINHDALGGATTSGSQQPIGRESAVLITTTPKTACGWRFDFWRLELYMRDVETPLVSTSTEREHVVVIPGITYDDQWIEVQCHAVYRFEGTGKILRDAAGKVMRSNRLTNRILFDA